MPPVSKVAKMPPAIRERLLKLFVQYGFGNIEGVTEEVNALLHEAGVPMTVGKSAIGEASKKYRRGRQRRRQQREAQ
jgi:Protein of unknown function (DUF3486)